MMPSLAVEHLEGSIGSGGAEASSSESSKVPSSGEGGAGSSSVSSSPNLTIGALKVPSKTSLPVVVILASDLSLASSAQ
jgi:hypothetical protein